MNAKHHPTLAQGPRRGAAPNTGLTFPLGRQDGLAKGSGMHCSLWMLAGKGPFLISPFFTARSILSNPA